jgi:geranylgeranylglycerol-phosphate geranylgeranyltransferase
MIKQFYRLGRPVNALAGCIAVLLSAYVAGPQAWWPVIMATVTVLLITVSTNAWNDYLDIEIDRINKPERPLPSGKISPREALLFSVAGSALSLVTAVFINTPAFFVALGSNLLLYIYSWKLKCTILWGNATVGAVVALCFIFGGLAAGNIMPIIPLAVTVFFALTGREILKTMADYPGDREHNCRTIAVAWGRDIARILFIVHLALSAILMIAAYFIAGYNPVYLYIILFVIYPLFAYIAISSKSSATGAVLEHNSTLMKYGFFIWFLAVALGAGLAP